MKILGRIFPPRKPAAATNLMSVETAHKIVRNYANFTAASSPLPGCVADVKRLPYSKDQIKNAIAVCLKSTMDAKLIQEFKYGYLMLCAWQKDVGEDTVGLEFTGLNLDDDPMRIAEQIQKHSENVSHWKLIMEAEQAALEREFTALLREV